MVSRAENIIEKPEKSPIDPIYDTNWCDMPAEIKSKCIGKMELNERLSLRCTAKAERLLVDSQNIGFYKGRFRKNAGKLVFSFYDEEEHKISKRFKNEKKAFKFLNYIWKDGVESIKLYSAGGIDDVFDEILSISQVAQMWIDKNSKIGSTFQICVEEDGSFEIFSERFADRIVSKNEKRVRIGTNNPERHILLERGLDESVEINYIDQYFRLTVISAEMKECDYDDNCKEWIYKMNPDIYDNPYGDDFYGYDYFYADDYDSDNWEPNDD